MNTTAKPLDPAAAQPPARHHTPPAEGCGPDFARAEITARRQQKIEEYSRAALAIPDPVVSHLFASICEIRGSPIPYILMILLYRSRSCSRFTCPTHAF